MNIKPLLIVVAGRPGAGKTTLAHALANEIRCPALCRDEFKEGLINTTRVLGHPGDEDDRKVYSVFFETIRFLLGRQISLVAEAAFQHKLWAPQLQPIQQIAAIRIVLCTIDPQLACLRHLERSAADPARARFHHDRELQSLPSPADFDPPKLDVPTLVVDTTTEYQPPLAAIANFLQMDRDTNS